MKLILNQMNKKNIVILVVLLVIVIAGFLIWKKNQKTEVNQQQSQNQDNNIVIKDDTKFGTRLTEEEIATIKNDNYFVWYEMPEFGIKFKVTPDTNNDLKYNIKDVVDIDNANIKNVTAYLYSESIIDFLGKDYCFHGDSFNIACSEGAIGKIPASQIEEAMKNTENPYPLCGKDRIITNVNDNIICFTGPQSPVLFGSQYEKYSKIVESKKFGIYLDTMEQL